MIPFRYLIAIFGTLMGLGAAVHRWPVVTLSSLAAGAIALVIWCSLALRNDSDR